ncbi:MAG: hypothetical protein ACRDTQ_00820 [Micromonosporaceae bacterium]
MRAHDLRGDEVVEPEAPTPVREHRSGSAQEEPGAGGAAASFSAVLRGTVVRATPVLAVSQLCFLPALVAILLIAAPPSMVAPMGDRGLKLAPSYMWSSSMWQLVGVLLLVVATYLAWAHAYAMIVAGALAVGREVGLGKAAMLALKATPRLFWAMILVVATLAAAVMIHWLAAVVLLFALAIHLHPAAPLLVFGRSSRRVDVALSIARGQGHMAALALMVIGSAYWGWNTIVPRLSFGAASVMAGAAVWSLLMTVTGAALAWGLLRHLRWPTGIDALSHAADWLIQVTEPRRREVSRRVTATSAVALAVTVGMAVALSLTPVSSWASDPEGRTSSWSAQLPDWNVGQGEGTLGAVVANDLVLVAVNQADPPGVVAYDRRGVRQWAYPYRGEVSSGLRFWVADDAVVLHNDTYGEFRVLDLRTGSLRLTIEDQPDPASAVVHRDTIVVPADGVEACSPLRGYDLRTGKRRWERADRCLADQGDAANSRGQVWVADRFRTGQIAQATDTSTVWSRTRGGAHEPSGVALDLETGDDLAKPYRMPMKTHGFHKISDKLYLQYPKWKWTGDCEASGALQKTPIQARDLSTGALRWTADVGQWSLQNLTDESCDPANLQPTNEGLLTGAPGVAGAQILDLRSGKQRLMLDERTEPLTLNGRAVLAVSGRTVITADSDPAGGFRWDDGAPGVQYVAFDARTGKRMWTRQCQGTQMLLSAQWFVCPHNGSIGGYGQATPRIWVRDLRSGRRLWATPGAPSWAGAPSQQLVSAGDGWLMTYQVRHEGQATKLEVRMYD